MLSLEVLIVALTAVAVSIIVCTLEVLLVVDIIYPTKPLSEITVMFGSIPSFCPTFIIRVFPKLLISLFITYPGILS